MTNRTFRTRKPGHTLSRAAVVCVLLLALTAGLRSATPPLAPLAPRFLHGHTGGVTTVAFSPDGRTLASGSWDGTVRLWSASTGKPFGDPLTAHTGGVSNLTFLPDGRTLLSATQDRAVRVWSTATLPAGPASGRPLGPPLLLPEPVDSLAFSPDGALLAYGRCARWEQTWCVRGEIVLLDLSDWLRVSRVTAQPICAPLAGHEGIVESLAFSPDGQLLASGSWDTTVRLWHSATGAPVGPPLAGHTDIVSSLAFSPDGATLASGSADRTIRLWDASAALSTGRATGAAIGQPLRGHTDIVMSVAFHPDGVTVASGSYDGTVRLWNTTTGQPIGPALATHAGMVAGVAFGPDGSTLASAGEDASVVIWDLGRRLP